MRFFGKRTVYDMTVQKNHNFVSNGIVVHNCVNYRVAKFIYENVASNRLMIHDASNRDAVVDYHCESDEPTVLVSPSMMEGVDLRGDRSRFQIMCKLPFPFLGDQVVSKRMQNDPTWYDYQTVRSIIQALGRSIRSEDDYAVSYILDTDWQFFYRKTKHMFPDEISQSIH